MSAVEAIYDVAIIGGGPGGMSAALWCADLGLEAVLLERDGEPGGQLLRTHNAIKNYLGVDAANGRELRDRFLGQVEKTGVTRLFGVEVVTADLVKKQLILSDGNEMIARAVVIATGLRRRKLGIPGEDEFEGRGILDSGERSKNDVAGKRVVIAGGGDAAVENAIILARTAERVFVVHRRGEFSARKEFIHRAAALENVEFVFNSRLSAIIGDDRVTGVDVQDISSGATLHVEADAVLIRVGSEPNSEVFSSQIGLDQNGFIVINGNCETSETNVFAIGDVAAPSSPTISTAVGMAAMAVKKIEVLLT